MKGSVATAALLGLVTFPVASGQSLRHDQTANDLADGEGAAAAQATTAFDGSPHRRLHNTDDANDLYDSVSTGTLFRMPAPVFQSRRSFGECLAVSPLVPGFLYFCVGLWYGSGT